MGAGGIPEAGVGVQGEQVYQGQGMGIPRAEGGIPGGRYTKESSCTRGAGILGGSLVYRVAGVPGGECIRGLRDTRFWG